MCGIDEAARAYNKERSGPLSDLCEKQGKLLRDWVQAGEAAKKFIEELFVKLIALQRKVDMEREANKPLRDEIIALEQEVQTHERTIKELRLSLNEPPC